MMTASINPMRTILNNTFQVFSAAFAKIIELVAAAVKSHGRLEQFIQLQQSGWQWALLAWHCKLGHNTIRYTLRACF